MKVADISNGEAIRMRSRLTTFRLHIDEIEQTLKAEHRDLREVEGILDDLVERIDRFKGIIIDIEREAEEF